MFGFVVVVFSKRKKNLNGDFRCRDLLALSSSSLLILCIKDVLVLKSGNTAPYHRITESQTG